MLKVAHIREEEESEKEDKDVLAKYNDPARFRQFMREIITEHNMKIRKQKMNASGIK